MATTTRTVGTTTTTTGMEAMPRVFHSPCRHLLVAADGRAFIIYIKPISNTWYVEWWSSNAARDSWGTVNALWNKALAGENTTLFRLKACKDASDNIYAVWVVYNYNLTRQEMYFCKFTKSVGGGWSAGSINNFWNGTSDGAGKLQSLDITYDGTYVQVFAGNDVVTANELVMWYSSNAGVSFNQSTVQANVGGYGTHGLAAYARTGETFLVYVDRNGGDYIKCRIITGTTIGGSTTIWSGSTQVGTSSTQHSHFGFFPLYIGNATVDWFIMSYLSDGSLRLKKYKSGWISGEVVLNASGQPNNLCRGYWDADDNKWIFWKAFSAAPYSWSPATDAVASETGDFVTVQVYPFKTSMSWHGYNAAGSGGTSTLSYYDTSLGEVFDFNINYTARENMQLDYVLAADGVERLILDHITPTFGTPTNFLMLETTFAQAGRELMTFDTLIPQATGTGKVAVEFSYVIAQQMREQVSYDTLIACAAFIEQLWAKEIPPTDIWVKEAATVDSWVKETPPADSWSKE